MRTLSGLTELPSTFVSVLSMSRLGVTRTDSSHCLLWLCCTLWQSFCYHLSWSCFYFVSWCRDFSLDISPLIFKTRSSKKIWTTSQICPVMYWIIKNSVILEDGCLQNRGTPARSHQAFSAQGIQIWLTRAISTVDSELQEGGGHVKKMWEIELGCFGNTEQIFQQEIWWIDAHTIAVYIDSCSCSFCEVDALAAPV